LCCKSAFLSYYLLQLRFCRKQITRSTFRLFSIHGTMKIPPAVVAIIDTKQFARLRKLKQVGSCQFTYPNATHTRFEHSLGKSLKLKSYLLIELNVLFLTSGVGYLAQKFARHLLEKYPDYMDAKDVLCVMLAGICHDLGHGPFSHLWEVFIHAARPNLGYQHEDTSILMFEHLLESNNLRPVLKELADIDERDIVFIKEQIGGILDEKTGLPNGKTIHDYTSWPYKGRGVEKSFLYEIVANKISGENYLSMMFKQF
jgi:HD superfamily phosphohydrolase